MARKKGNSVIAKYATYPTVGGKKIFLRIFLPTTEVLVKSDMRRRNCFWLNQKVSDNSGYDTEVLYGPIEL